MRLANIKGPQHKMQMIPFEYNLYSTTLMLTNAAIAT